MSASPSVQPPTIAEVLRLAWPASVAASVTPLLGTVDVWALARSDRPLDIAAVGLGSVIFSLVYWAFGFIRMSVAGLTAQASGAEDPREERASLARGVFIGGGLGLLLLLLQWPIGAAAFPLLALGSNASAETLAAAEAYYAARIWGAPFVIATYAAFGWLTAKGRTDALMTVSLAMTALNIALDYAFVVYFGWGAEGVAIGTLIAEVAGALFAGGYILSILRREGGASAHWASLDLWSRGAVMRTIAVNRDIFIRTLLLALSFAWFVQRGGAFGDVVLAANQVLLQLFLFTGLALDGTAIAAETLVGRAIGDRDKRRGEKRLLAAIKATFAPALFAAAVFAFAYLLFGSSIIALLTPDGAIREAANAYLIWVVISPLIVVVGFQLDGIFIGATKAREMRDGMIVSAAIFLGASIWMAERWENHGLWAAFSLYFVLRAATLGWYFQRQRFWRLSEAQGSEDAAAKPS